MPCPFDYFVRNSTKCSKREQAPRGCRVRWYPAICCIFRHLRLCEERQVRCFVRGATCSRRSTLHRAFTIRPRQLMKALTCVCVVLSCLSESQGQDRRSASAGLQIRVFVMPTLVGAAKVGDVPKDSQKVVLSFDLSEHQQTREMHIVRPLVMPNARPTGTLSQSAILDTAIFVAE